MADFLKKKIRSHLLKRLDEILMYITLKVLLVHRDIYKQIMKKQIFHVHTYMYALG